MKTVTGSRSRKCHKHGLALPRVNQALNLRSINFSGSLNSSSSAYPFFRLLLNMFSDSGSVGRKRNKRGQKKGEEVWN